MAGGARCSLQHYRLGPDPMWVTHTSRMGSFTVPLRASFPTWGTPLDSEIALPHRVGEGDAPPRPCRGHPYSSAIEETSHGFFLV